MQTILNENAHNAIERERIREMRMKSDNGRMIESSMNDAESVLTVFIQCWFIWKSQHLQIVGRSTWTMQIRIVCMCKCVFAVKFLCSTKTHPDMRKWAEAVGYILHMYSCNWELNRYAYMLLPYKPCWSSRWTGCSSDFNWIVTTKWMDWSTCWVEL